MMHTRGHHQGRCSGTPCTLHTGVHRVTWADHAPCAIQAAASDGPNCAAFHVCPAQALLCAVKYVAYGMLD